MSADAIAIFHPKDPDKLRPFLDLDDESEESDGLYAEELDDGTMLVHTFQPYEVFEESPAEARAWLAQFGEALPDVHDDPRGLLFFPDSFEPVGTTYDAVVAEAADKGVFVATALLDEDEDDAHAPAIDFDALQALAGQLMGADHGGTAPAGTSFEVGKLLEGMQQQLAEALGIHGGFPGAQAEGKGEGDGEGAAREKGAVHDDEFAPEASEKPGTPKK